MSDKPISPYAPNFDFGAQKNIENLKNSYLDAFLAKLTFSIQFYSVLSMICFPK
jgi:hypothetical protein